MSDMKGPSLAEIKNFISNKNMVEFHLTNDRILKGRISWHDDEAFQIQSEEGQTITILKKAVMYYCKVN